MILGDAANNYNLTVFVRVSDVYGAVTVREASVVVKPVPLNSSTFSELSGEVVRDMESGDLGKGLGVYDRYLFKKAFMFLYCVFFSENAVIIVLDCLAVLMSRKLYLSNSPDPTSEKIQFTYFCLHFSQSQCASCCGALKCECK